MALPPEYSAVAVENELRLITNELSTLREFLFLNALAAAPNDARDGWLAVSDGTGSGFDAVSGAGLYRFVSPNWVFIG